MTGRITSVDIARYAGVSRATVSTVLNNRMDIAVSAKTRMRVLAAAETLGYVPNSAARMLVSGRSYTLGLILCRPDLLRIDAFMPQLIFGVSRVCNRVGYKLLVEAGDEAMTADAYLSLARGKRIDGLIVLGPKRRDPGLAKLIESGFPVIVSGSIGHPQENGIGTSQRKGGRTATRHLIELGHKKIAHIPFAPLGYAGSSERFAGYRSALRSAGLPLNERLVEPADFSAESGYETMKRLLERNVKLTALFAGNDTIAVGAMAALRDAGRSIPEDVAVVGYDDVSTAAYAYPPLTTIRSLPVEQGELVALAALSLLEGKPPGSQQDLLPLELIVRESCGARRSGTGFSPSTRAS
jgi:DNA-binding LacI/PurR family transcriptional regulator